MCPNAGRKPNGLVLKYKISISGSTTEDVQVDNSPEYKSQKSTATIQSVTSHQHEREPMDMNNFNATLDVHGDKTSHTFSKVLIVSPHAFTNFFLNLEFGMYKFLMKYCIIFFLIAQN